MGEDGLKLLREAADRNHLLLVSEVMDQTQIPLIADYVDILQVGARNMQNYNLLRELGALRKPILLKRGISATIEELLLSAEYILSGGNYDVILCERGIRTFETSTRNTMDISAIPVVKSLSHLPIVADPSHGTGRRDKVLPMARAAVAAGADGLLVEVHHDPDHALSDGAQSLFPQAVRRIDGPVAHHRSSRGPFGIKTRMQTVAIFGVGLIGGSFALAIRKAGFTGRIIGVSSDDTIRAALALQVIDEALPAQEAAAQADLLYLAQPIHKIIDSLAELDVSGQTRGADHRCRQHQASHRRSRQPGYFARSISWRPPHGRTRAPGRGSGRGGSFPGPAVRADAALGIGARDSSRARVSRAGSPRSALCP